MALAGDWNYIIDNAETEYFVGREQELSIFRREINRTPPRYVVFYITGQAGVGKTTLLTHYRKIASETGFLLADCDEQQRDVPAVLGRFAHQLAEQGFPLKHFDERYEVYYQKMHEIENDPDAPQGLAALIGRTVVRAAFIGGDLLPGVRKGLEYLPRESIETQASEWAEYLAKKLKSKDEVALIREPISILTPLFFQDLNEIAEKRKVLLCFDNFHATRQELEEWLLRLREYKPSFNTRIAIASQDLPGARWDVLRKVTLTIRLDIFTEREVEAFLDAYGIIDVDRRREILEFSGRLPVLMSWLSAPEGQDADPTVPTHDIVERFLRWVPEPSLRQIGLLAAISRVFNLDILRLLLNDSGQSIDVQSAFDWLLTMPFVQQRSHGWQYHGVVRRMMLHYQRQKSPQTYRYMHANLADFYNMKRAEISSSIKGEWIDEEWRACSLAYAYHFLVADHVQHWNEIMNLFAEALRKRRSFAVEVIELLCSDDVHDELSHEQNEIVQLFRHQLEAIESGDLDDGFEMFDKLCAMPELSSQAKCYAFAYRGEGHRLSKRWEKALSDFGEALHHIPEDAWAIVSRGQIYQAMERYEEALADFERAIALDEKDAEAIANRGETYRSMERDEEALADFNRAITLDEDSAWAFVIRGQIYVLMERDEEALADFNRAITLDENYASAIASRGITYRLMKRYEEALADFNRAITLDENYAWAIVSRGQTYRLLGPEHYAEALADFDRAIALDSTLDWAISARGETHHQMGHYAEALADFTRAVTLDENYAWAIANRGDIYWLKGKYQEALADFTRAITLDENYTRARLGRGRVYRAMSQYEKSLAEFNQVINLGEENAWAYGGRGETYRKMGRYEEALADFNRAIALDKNLDWAVAMHGVTCRLIGRYEEALADFNRAIDLDEKDCWYRYQQGLVYLVIGRREDFREALRAAIELAHANLGDEPDRLTASFNLALFNLVSGNPLAETQYKELISACSSIPHLQDARDDLDDFLTIQPSNELVQHIHSQLQISLVRLQELSTDDTSSSS